MNNNLPRILAILAAVLVSAYVVSDLSRFKLGPDLTGGTILIYRVQDTTAVNLDEMVPALKNRLDPAGLKNYQIRPLGNDRVEIVMPEADLPEVETIKLRVSTIGNLEFRMVADRKKHESLIESALIQWPEKTLPGEAMFVPYGVWNPVVQQGGDADKAVIEKAAKTQDQMVEENVWFRPAESLNNVDVSPDKHILREKDGRTYILARWVNDDLTFDQNNLVMVDDQAGGDGEHYVLMFDDRWDVTGEYLTRVEPTLDNDNRLALAFNFSDEGGTRFRALTTEFRPDGDYRYRLGIVLDGRLRSAPQLNQVISNSGIISGNFTEKEVKSLKQILEAGKLPYALEKEPVQERTVGPSLGEDTIRSGTIAIVVSFALVVLFTVTYYRLGGLVAVIALFLNLLFTVALMVLFSATWTLPGLAGLVLTVGMAVDSNVLIFERIREELALGRPLGLAMRQGYEKAWGTIFDSNLTTILTAVILFWIGTDQVKGFAVTLILGILTSMFSAVFVTRVIFEVLYERRFLKRLSMMQWLSNPNVDFLKWSRLCALISLVLIGLGIVATVARGWNSFDIDFTGGTAAGLQFKEPTTTAEVRKIASTAVNNPTVVSMEIDAPGETPGTRFLIRTDERDAGKSPDEGTLKSRLAKAFVGNLATVSVTAGAVSDIPAEGEVPESIKAFAGGKQVDLTFAPAQTESFARQAVAETIAATLEGNVDPLSQFVVIPVGEAKGEKGKATYTTFRLATRQDAAALVSAMSERLTSSPVFDPYDQFGAQVANETQVAAIWAITLSWIGIIIYVWLRFGSWTFGIAGVVALVHDVLVAVGLLSIFSLLAVYVPGVEKLLITDMRINLDIVAALLTLIGFSINDTIVIFDRIREIKGKSPRITRDIVHRALNGTLSRTIITSLTVFLVVVVLFVVGGEALHGFAFVLVVGTLTGTYSTIYIACPLVLLLEDWRTSRQAKPVAAPAVA